MRRGRHDINPLAELQYRGVLWTHRNGRDWTVGAFLGSSDGLGIDVAGAIAHLRAAAPLQAAYFDGLLIADEIRSLLLWLDDPEGFRATVDAAMWDSFRDLCRRTYGIDQESDGPLRAAERLGDRRGAWEAVW